MIYIPDELNRYAEIPSDCPRFDNHNPDYRCSVDYDKSKYRINIAKREANKKPVEIKDLLSYIHLFFEKMDMDNKFVLIDGTDVLGTLNYEQIKSQFKLNNQSDIIWLRFTTDGFLGTVASSNDINFEYNHNSGKIVKAIGKEWDTNRILVIPVQGIKKREDRLLIEQMLGNYLIYEKGVPVLDKYSHNLGK